MKYTASFAIGSDSIEDVVTFDSSKRQFSINSTDFSLFGKTINITLTGSLNDKHETTSFRVRILLNNLGPPYYKPSLKDIKMKAGETLRFTYPRLVDDDGDAIGSVIVFFGMAQHFITGVYPSYTLKPTNNSVGEFPITVIVKNNNTFPLTGEYMFNIIV